MVFVGDSFLVGQALREEHLVTSLVGAGLHARGREAEIYNLGGSDWGTGQELLLLRRLGRILEPDAVVLFLYPANDVINNSILLAERTSVSGGDLVRPYVLPAEGGELRVRYFHPLRALLRRHSRLFSTLESRVLALAAEHALAWLDPRLEGEDFVGRARQGRAPREDLEIFRLHDPGDRWERAWKTTYELLRAFRDECEAIQAKLLVVVVPSVHQVVRNAKGIRLDITTRTAVGRALDELLDWNLPERRLARFFEAEGIEARLLLMPLREAARSGLLVYGRDEHLARAGHEVAARPVVAWLLEEKGGEGSTRIRGRPVRALPDASTAPALLDFREARHAQSLGEGWISWTPPEPGKPGGWLTGPSALAVLPAREGELVLRGWVAHAARLPIQGHLELVGASRYRFRLERTGRFGLRFPMPRKLRSWPTADGYVAVVLAPGETHRVGSIRAGLLVERIGFQSSSVSEAASG